VVRGCQRIHNRMAPSTDVWLYRTELEIPSVSGNRTWCSITVLCRPDLQQCCIIVIFFQFVYWKTHRYLTRLESWRNVARFHSWNTCRYLWRFHIWSSSVGFVSGGHAGVSRGFMLGTCVNPLHGWIHGTCRDGSRVFSSGICICVSYGWITGMCISFSRIP
jgi:hypothetical protein